VQFGLNFFPCVAPAQKSAAQFFREALHLASFADELGYTHIRQVEHYFRPYGGYSPNPIVFLAAVSQRTRRARLITGAVLPDAVQRAAPPPSCVPDAVQRERAARTVHRCSGTAQGNAVHSRAQV
jgi:hypothetical protein